MHTCSLLALSLNVNLLLNCRNVSLCRKQSKHVYVPELPVQSCDWCVGRLVLEQNGVAAIFLNPKRVAEIMVPSSQFTAF